MYFFYRYFTIINPVLIPPSSKKLSDIHLKLSFSFQPRSLLLCFGIKRKRGHKKTLQRIVFGNVNNLDQHFRAFHIFEYLPRNPLHFALFPFLRIFRAFGLKIHIHVLPVPQTEIFSGIKRHNPKKGKEAYASYICMRVFLEEVLM
ncbi:hypothetical protein CDAR_574461 [Caerostris darwini]|uniref:Uncharacterized protein n=1 Tax=Caerostris darwini TaxID=1538125 RepID=A0AAV4UHY8_9ARAC|nr:hypothetical protein CDAR_574461 [Caerostris darwini]